ncbi:hypothetical protein [Fusibacter sp. JL216-2]|uniref:hypothetical protein n=1 Tax=Fusibacter sp. JL216-2 TaxID=3071453 RepID=UPI003D336F4C
MKRSTIKSTLRKNRGSLSVEAIITTTSLLLLLFTMSIFLRLHYVYDSVDHSIYNASKHVSVNEGFVLLAGSNGAGEMNARPILVKAMIKNEIAKNNFVSRWEEKALKSLQVSEEADFDVAAGAGTYKITYDYPLPAGLDCLQLTHQIRIRSIWSKGQVEAGLASGKEDVVKAYTSEHGRNHKIYHIYADCWTLKSSWKSPGSVETQDEASLSGYRLCKICAKKNEADAEKE